MEGVQLGKVVLILDPPFGALASILGRSIRQLWAFLGGVCACVHACVRACVRACMRVCLWCVCMLCVCVCVVFVCGVCVCVHACVQCVRKLLRTISKLLVIQLNLFTSTK